MSEWELVSVNKKKPKESEWEIESQPTPDLESKGWSGVASDLGNKAMNSALDIPGQILNAPGEIYGAGKQIFTQPKRASQNLGAGFGELGHNILSSPGNIRDYLVKKDILSKQSPGMRLPESIMPKNYDYANALGASGEQSGDSMLRAIPSMAAMAPAAEFVPSMARGIGKGIEKLKPESPYHFIQKSYDVKEKSLSNMFSEVSKEAKEAGLKINLPKNLVQEIKKSGPKTDRFNNFVDKAKKGDYDALRKLQHELFTRAKAYSKSELASENDFGAHLFEKREKLNNAIIKALEDQERPDLAAKLTEAKHGWKNLEDLYHSNPTISKLVGTNREVPMTYTSLRKESTSIKKLKEAHPEIEKKLKNIRRAKQAGTLISAGAIKKYMFGKNEPTGDYND